MTKSRTSTTKTPSASSRGSKKPAAQAKPKTAKPVKTAARAESKANQVQELLRRKQGASLAEMQKATGWQAHSVRGFLSGTVKNRLGLKLDSAKIEDGERRYSIAAA